MTTRVKLMAALGIVIAILIALIWTAVVHASTYYVTVSELKQEGQSAVGRETTVSGDIIGSSVNWDPSKSMLYFTVKDTSGNQGMPVVFRGAKPDDFSNNWPVVVTGTLEKNGSFQAQKLLVKCPSKYQSKPQTRTYTASVS